MTQSLKRNVKTVFIVGIDAIVVLMLLLMHLRGLGKLAQSGKTFTARISDRSAAPLAKDGFPRILLYITTHVSDQHLEFLKRCWPYILHNTKLVAMSDIFIFSTGNPDASEYILSMIREVVVPADHKYYSTYKRHRNITLVQANNPGYQEGANLALKEAATHGWFHGYDWVVKVNPDVLIYNDTWILDTMTQDQNASGIFVDCFDGNGGKRLIQTDFFSIRPEAFPEEPFRNMLNLAENAERTATSFFSQSISNGTDRWLPDIGQMHLICRVGWERGWGSPVLHSHEFLNDCPQLVRMENYNTSLKRSW